MVATAETTVVAAVAAAIAAAALPATTEPAAPELPTAQRATAAAAVHSATTMVHERPVPGIYTQYVYTCAHGWCRGP